jgi:hypothetical protein
MKTILKILFILIPIAHIPHTCTAQDSIRRKIFVSVHSGIYLPSISGFREMYHSHSVFINGISLGIPFANKGFFFYVKGMYFQKAGTQIIYHFEYDPHTGKPVNTYTTRGGDITWRQLLGNTGIQYNLPFGLTNNLMFNGGITLVKASEKTKDNSAGSEAKGFTGFFLGAGYEKRISDTFGLFSEVQYNFDIRKFEILGHKYGGANFNIGIRYYFSQK